MNWGITELTPFKRCQLLLSTFETTEKVNDIVRQNYPPLVLKYHKKLGWLTPVNHPNYL